MRRLALMYWTLFVWRLAMIKAGIKYPDAGYFELQLRVAGYTTDHIDKVVWMYYVSVTPSGDDLSREEICAIEVSSWGEVR